MIPCISQVTTLGTPFDADLPAFAKVGWPAVELWLTKLETFLESHSIGDARSILDSEGLKAVAASIQGGLLLSTGAEREVHWNHFQRRLELLQALGVPTLVLAPDFVREPSDSDVARAVENLVKAAELARPAGVRLALEPQKHARFCASLDTVAAVVAHAGAPNLGICLDLFHFYTGPSKFEDLGLLTADSVAHVQVCDLTGVPRELASDSDRIFPGEGDLPVKPVIEHLARLGYRGPVSLEMMNPGISQMPADRVVGVALQALERTLGEWLELPPAQDEVENSPPIEEDA